MPKTEKQDIWASAYAEVDGYHVFDAYVESEASDLGKMLITAKTPSQPNRVMVAIARIPSTEVASVFSA